MSGDMWRDMADVIELFNRLDNIPEEPDYKACWEEVSALIEARGLRNMGGPFPDLLATLLGIPGGGR